MGSITVGATVWRVSGGFVPAPPQALTHHNLHFVAGQTSQQPEASVHQGRSPASRSANPLVTESTRPTRLLPVPLHLSRIEHRPSAVSPAVEPLSNVEQVTVSPRPYFVPSTASALEILTNVAIQDLLAHDAEESYESTDIPSPTPFSDSWDSFEFDFVHPFALDDYSDSDWEAGYEDIADDTPQSPSKPIQLISSSVVDMTLGNTCLDPLPREDYGDREGSIVTPFPHPHLLSPIIEEYEDDGSSGSEMDSEDEDEMSDSETIRPSTSVLARPRLSGDARIADWGVWRCKAQQCPM